MHDIDEFEHWFFDLGYWRALVTPVAFALLALALTLLPNHLLVTTRNRKDRQ